MPRLISVAMTAALTWVAVFAAPLPPDMVEATPTWDVATALAWVAAQPPPPPPQPEIVAAGSWEYDTPSVGIAPPRVRVARDYGPVPELTGPILTVAAQFIGTPYVAGGESPSGFDCSGFVQYVYAANGVSVSRTVDGLRNAGAVTTSPAPGDIIWTSHHVGLYVAPGWQIDSPRPGKTIQVRPIWQSSPVYIHVT